MTFGQVNPARLQGDALRRWYLRSPDEIEQERLAASDRAYDRFFNRAPTAAPLLQDTTFASRAADGQQAPTILWAADSPNRWSGERATPSGPGTHLQRSAAASQPADGGADCISCHGRLAPPAFTFPWPWRGDRSLRDAPTSPPSKPPERDRKQCELQYEFDTDICNGQATEEAKAVCHGSAANRFAHCRRTGELDTPYLSTFRGSPRRR